MHTGQELVPQAAVGALREGEPWDSKTISPS